MFDLPPVLAKVDISFDCKLIMHKWWSNFAFLQEFLVAELGIEGVGSEEPIDF